MISTKSQVSWKSKIAALPQIRLAGTLAQKSDLEVVSADLFYAPFHPESYFYVDSVMGAVTFEKNLIG